MAELKRGLRTSVSATTATSMAQISNLSLKTSDLGGLRALWDEMTRLFYAMDISTKQHFLLRPALHSTILRSPNSNMGNGTLSLIQFKNYERAVLEREGLTGGKSLTYLDKAVIMADLDYRSDLAQGTHRASVSSSTQQHVSCSKQIVLDSDSESHWDDSD